MEQYISPALDHVNNASETSSTVISQDNIIKTEIDLEELPKFAHEISDEEVQIICVKKQKKCVKHAIPPIKVESDNEEQEKDFSKPGKSSEEKGSDDKHTQVLVTARCNSPKDITCSICLGEFDNKSFLNQCFHAFCFYCILQWSEIVRTCPLCKATFSSIVHSVKSMMEYELHTLPRLERSSKQQLRIDVRRMGHRITWVDNMHDSQQQHDARPAYSSWEWRTRRRERRISAHKRKQVEAIKKRKSVYANNLWVRDVSQNGRAKFRDTTPKFFHDNPACTHRLVPWLTREFNCLLNDDQDHVDFLLQLVMTLMSRVEIGSDDFIQQVQPFLSEKTHHFAHEFLSFARSPYDMPTHDERAHYDLSRPNVNQDTATPFISNTSTTGWDSPDELGTETLSHSASTPGPSGLSTTMASSNWNGSAGFHEGGNWSPSFVPDLQQRHLSDESTSTDSPLQEDVTNANHATVFSPKEFNLDLRKLSKREYKGKGKQLSRCQLSRSTFTQPAVSISNPTSNYITVSSCGSTESQSEVIVLSSEEASSPVIIHLPEQHTTSANNLVHRSSSTERSSDSRPKSRQDSYKSLRSRKRSGKRSLKSILSSRVVTRPRKRSTRSRSPTDNQAECDSHSRIVFLDETDKSENERPSSPTEQQMRQEISELENKIAEDTKRLTQLLIKQEKRRLNNSGSKLPNANNMDENSGTDELSR